MASLSKSKSEEFLTLNSRLKKLPPYLFMDLDRKKEEAIRQGADIIHLGIGDPDLPSPAGVVEKLKEAASNPNFHHYPPGKGQKKLRESIARWYHRRFRVLLDPDREVLVLIGSKEGIGHLPLALVSPGEEVLIPDPGYPPYFSGTVLAAAKPVPFALKEEKGFLPELSKIKTTSKTKLIFLNYPNNPTGAAAPLSFFKEAASWAQKKKIWVAHDAAYSEMYFEKTPASFLQAPGAREVGIEFHSLSKTFSMTGWRVGWACGNSKALSALSQVKDNFDSGVFGAVQEAASYALDHLEEEVEKTREVYRRRKKILAGGLRKLGWKVFPSQATFYLWVKTPKNLSSQECAGRILQEARVIATPGTGFGSQGEGYVRFTLTASEDRLQEALNRLSHIQW